MKVSSSSPHRRIPASPTRKISDFSLDDILKQHQEIAENDFDLLKPFIHEEIHKINKIYDDPTIK
jgi:hypothetical protein